MTSHRHHPLRAAIACALIAAAGACGGRSAPAPEPGQMRGTPPDLRGRRVVLLPVQQVAGVAGDPDAELSYVLRDVGREIEWVGEADVAEALARAPAVDASVRGLPVGQFLATEVRRVGDPLFGELRRIAALVDAEAVLIPVAASFEPNQAIPGSGPRVRFTMALIEPRTGQVIWFGIEEGGEYPAGDPRGLASAVERVARTLLWYVSDRSAAGPGEAGLRARPAEAR